MPSAPARTSARSILKAARPRPDPADAPPSPARNRTRERLLSAALALFADRGFDGVTTAEVAVAGGVSQSVVLYHFATKENLWREAMRLLFQRVTAEAPPPPHLLSDLDEIARLRVALRGLVQTAARFPELGRVVVREGSAGGERLDWLRDTLLAPHYEDFTRFFSEAVEGGKLKRYPPVMVMLMIHSAAAMMFNLAPLSEGLLGRSPFEAEVVRTQSDLLVDVILSGLLKEQTS